MMGAGTQIRVEPGVWEGVRRILVVEDDEAVRTMIEQYLRRGGYDVRSFASAEAALRGAAEFAPFDLLLTDVHLPGISGLDLARLLLADAPLRPVVLITADADEALARGALQSGAAGYLLKPFELFELDAAVNQAMARLELVEATEALARSSAAQLPDGGAGGGMLPSAWLAMGDARSGAGLGHGYRVARIAGVLARALPGGCSAAERRALNTAARAHELGRLLGPVGALPELARRTAQFLANLGVEDAAVRAVRSFRERWDGSGGPEGLSGADIPVTALILGAADALDHIAVGLCASDVPAEEVAPRAVDAVLEDAEAAFGRDVAAALIEARGSIEAICSLAMTSRAAMR